MPDEFLRPRSRRSIAAENRAELETWIDERTEQLAGEGLSRLAARAQAQQEFGDLESAHAYAVRQDVAAELRDRIRILAADLVADMRIGARSLVRRPLISLVVLITFALGVGLTTSVFSVLHAVLLRALPYADERALVYLPTLDNGVLLPGLGGGRHSTSAFNELRARTSSFSAIAAVTNGAEILHDESGGEQIQLAGLSSAALDVLGAAPALGRRFRSDEASGAASDGVVILLDELWRRRFGADPRVVGTTIELGNDRRRVIGVMPPMFRVPTYEQAQLLIPVDVDAYARNPRTASARVLRLFARLRKGMPERTAQADIDRAMTALRAQAPRDFERLSVRVVPVRLAVTGAARAPVVALFCSAVFVLLLACANVAGILVARTLARQPEFAVRKALGAGRVRLVRQFLAEGLVLAAAGTAVSLVVAQLGVGWLRSTVSEVLPQGMRINIDGSVIGFGMIAAVVAAFGATILPALTATKTVATTLRAAQSRISHASGSRRMRVTLVAGQLAIALVLLMGAGLMFQSIRRLAALDLGYSTQHTLVFRPLFQHPKTNAEQVAYYSALYPALHAIPGVIDVGGGDVPTSGQGSMTGVEAEGSSDTRSPDARYTVASDDYFRTLSIPVLAGRVFRPDDRDDAPGVAVISEALARRLWPARNPVGLRVRTAPSKPWLTVVGVVGDVRMGAADAIQPTIYTSQRQDHWRAGGWVELRANGDPAALAASVREVIHRLDPTLVLVGLRTLDEVRDATPAVAERRLELQLMLVFASIALVVSAIGVYALCAYSVEERRREFGIRIALGASERSVLSLALGEALRIILFGVLLGVPLAIATAHELRALLFETSPLEPAVVTGVLATLVATALVASLVPARRALRLDPVEVLRAS